MTRDLVDVDSLPVITIGTFAERETKTGKLAVFHRL
jgi:hypothetical protein